MKYKRLVYLKPETGFTFITPKSVGEGRATNKRQIYSRADKWCTKLLQFIAWARAFSRVTESLGGTVPCTAELFCVSVYIFTVYYVSIRVL